MDPLSDVLRAVRLDGAFFYYVEARHPWAVQAVSAVQLVPRVLPEAEHLISYHILIEGLCWAGLADEPPVALRPGDAIVFPHGDPHVLASSEALQERLVDQGLLYRWVAQHALGQSCLDEARRNGVHTDLERRVFDCQASRQRGDRTFGCRIADELAQAALAHDRGDVDQRAVAGCLQ